MKFEPRKFYQHVKGRSIAVLGTVKTHRWGAMFVIEETDITGHGISCVESNVDVGENWVEIGESEWDRNFKGVKNA